MIEKPRANRTLVIIGSILVTVGAFMCAEGWEHTLSGEPIEATTRTRESTGPETLLFGLVGLVFGGFLVRRGLQGRKWP